MTHQEGLTAAAKIAAAYPDNQVTLNLLPRLDRGTWADTGTSDRYAVITLDLKFDVSLDEIVAHRERIRELGYEAELATGDLKIVRRAR